MCDTYSDEFGMLDFQRSQHGSGMSQRSQVGSQTSRLMWYQFLETSMLCTPSALQSKRFVSELGRLAEQTSNSTFTVQQMKDIAKVGTGSKEGTRLQNSNNVICSTSNSALSFLQRIGVQVRNFDDFISSLNNQNYLLKKAPRTYQLQTASCL